MTEVQFDSSTVLVCLTTGFPLPSITWTWNGEALNVYRGNSLSTRLDIVEFAASSMNDSDDFESSGYTGSGSIEGLLMMYTNLSMEQVRELGELGVVSLLFFEETVRGDTGDYVCTATNMLPQTTTLSRESGSIPLVILGEYIYIDLLQFVYILHFSHAECPDPPVNVTVSEIDARWVVLRWTPSFDGNRPVTNFTLYISSMDSNSSMTQVPDGLMSSGGELMFNISMQGVIIPYTNYSFTVDACNEIGCSNQSDPSPVIRTLEDGEKQTKLKYMFIH